MRLIVPREKPDTTDTEPPDEARPDTTATSLTPIEGTLTSPAVKFTTKELPNQIEHL